MLRMLEAVARGAAGALTWGARVARSLGTGLRAMVRRGRNGGPRSTASALPDPDNTAFLNEVSETLRRLETSGDPPSPAADPAPVRSRLASAMARLGRLREPLRRHEDILLAAALLLGILVMVAHWRLSGDVHVPLRAERAGAPSSRSDPERREPPRPPEAHLQNTGSSR